MFLWALSSPSSLKEPWCAREARCLPVTSTENGGGGIPWLWVSLTFCQRSLQFKRIKTHLSASSNDVSFCNSSS